MRRLKLINAISEAIIPILGVLFFEWGIYFILLFYFIDLIVSEAFIYLKVDKIIAFQRIKFPFKIRYGRLIFNTLLMCVLILLAHIALYFIVPSINFYQEFVDFINYVEVGIPIPQGYILLPLVILGNFQQYKVGFIKTNSYKFLSWKNVVYSRRKALLIGMIGGMIAITFAFFLTIPASIYIFLIITVKFYIDAYMT
ncbi:hypothetical protein CW751_05080 [Brumimicrobium salinarum]|uniref:Uncharacterized protein n=1 Tax=Brumimicrobium salinarum TaxID=2058658 RepID=A0A2I0R4Y8_9FLAO|nr:hypothetical protein [Brumimicrobium salinarum]PKR81430.1 hypothetical protein CW751_05080 [Brumimicrobium salinarum]